MQYELITVKEDKTVVRRRDNACPKFPELCSLPAGGKYPPVKLKQDNASDRG